MTDSGSVVLEKIFKNVLCIFTILLLSPLGEGLSPSLKDAYICSILGRFVQNLVKISPVVLEKKIFK